VGSKTKRIKGLHKMGADGKWVPGKVSELSPSRPATI